LHTQDGEQASLGAVLLGLLTRIHSHHGRAPKLNGELEEQGRAPRGAEAMETELVEGPDQIRSMVEMLFPAIKCSMHESDCIFRFLRHSGQGIETRVTATSVRDLLSSAHAHKAIVGVSREEGFQPGELEAFVTYVCRFVTDTCPNGRSASAPGKSLHTTTTKDEGKADIPPCSRRSMVRLSHSPILSTHFRRASTSPKRSWTP